MGIVKELVEIWLNEVCDIFFSSFALDRTMQPQKPKWEKRLPKQLSVNTFDTCGILIILPIEVSTTDTSKVQGAFGLWSYGQFHRSRLCPYERY